MAQGKSLSPEDLIAVSGEFFTISTRGNSTKVQLDQVERVEIFKIDEVTTDLICVEIWLAGGAEQRPILVHEDVPGFAALMELFGTLPGFQTDWFSRVSQPPFSECRLKAFERRA
ncbi:MAG: hypothetical protein R3B98_02365 [Hyphomonas sp.]